jgi:hypothetical protein
VRRATGPPPVVPVSGIVLALPVPEALLASGAATVEAIPVSYYSGVRARGFGSLFFMFFPDGADLRAVQATAAAAGVNVTAIPAIDESATEAIPLPPDPETGVRYAYDPALLRSLRAGEWEEFVAALESGKIAGDRLVHFTTQPFELSAGLLLLPGLRVVVGGDSDAESPLLRVLLRLSVRSGAFSIPEFHRSFGQMAVWKYTAENDRILVCFNFVDSHAVADVVCPDAEDVEGCDKLELFELLSETTFRREPDALRTVGLHVILHEY